ncbi:putative glycosyltransferase 7 [Hibiscus syriacus]|uniref:Glycosyltransferase 7 n=1 Tax=Hibiscus syriacus TaxID=106335 RepID=A0A6A3AVA4_HIBSY|nr:putative glycosyltransferase 7 [Hibiscus syriacus]KAE8707015.1 putative glycosyltransferase 7 [Hibiscus syriacus]
MVSPESSHSQFSPMAKPRNRSFWCFSDGFLHCGGVVLAIFLVCTFWYFFTSNLNFSFSIADPLSNSVGCKESGFGVKLKADPKDQTFYDDPEMSYSVEKPVKDWDEKRKEWLKHHPSFADGASERIVLVTGSQPKPCKNPIGDHLLLHFFKNKVDYCRIHGYDIFYNNLLLLLNFYV